MMDPTQAAGQGQQPAPQGDKTVCISARADGTFMVYLENEAAEDPANPGAEAAGAQPAQDIDSALELAKQMLGGDDSASGSGNDSADALFQQGFNKARGTPLNQG